MRFATAEARSANQAALRQEIAKAFLTKTAAEWEPLLNEAGVPAMRVWMIGEALADPDLKARNLFHVFDRVPGVKGPVTVPLLPFKLSTWEARADAPPPSLGQPTDEILQSIGYPVGRLKELRERRVI